MQQSSNERQSGLSQHNNAEIRKLSGGKRGGTGGLHIFSCSEANEESSEGVRRVRQGGPLNRLRQGRACSHHGRHTADEIAAFIFTE